MYTPNVFILFRFKRNNVHFYFKNITDSYFGVWKWRGDLDMGFFYAISDQGNLTGWSETSINISYEFNNNRIK